MGDGEGNSACANAPISDAPMMLNNARFISFLFVNEDPRGLACVMHPHHFLAIRIRLNYLRSAMSSAD